MAKAKNSPPKGLTAPAVAVIAIVCLGVGFYAGMVFQNSKSPQLEAGLMEREAPAGQGMASQIAAAEAETRAHPDDPAVWTHLGNLYFDADQPEKSVTAYEKSLALQPGNPNVLTDQGVMFRKMGEFDQAIACFDKAIAADPGHIIASFNKSIVLLHDKNDLPGAIAALEFLAARNPAAVVPGGRGVTQVIEDLKSGHDEQGGQSGPGAPPGQDAGPGFLR